MPSCVTMEVLFSMGFDKSRAESVLNKNNGDLDITIEELLTGSFTEPQVAPPTSSQNQAHDGNFRMQQETIVSEVSQFRYANIAKVLVPLFKKLIYIHTIDITTVLMKLELLHVHQFVSLWHI